MGGSIIGIDPGWEKCGVAVVERDGVCKERHVVPSEKMVSFIKTLCVQYEQVTIVLGDGTGSDLFVKQLRQANLPNLKKDIVIIDEFRSTEEARKLYLLENRRGWRRFVPIGLQMPDQPVDGYVAEVLARKYLEQ